MKMCDLSLDTLDNAWPQTWTNNFFSSEFVFVSKFLCKQFMICGPIINWYMLLNYSLMMHINCPLQKISFSKTITRIWRHSWWSAVSVSIVLSWNGIGSKQFLLYSIWKSVCHCPIFCLCPLFLKKKILMSLVFFFFFWFYSEKWLLLERSWRTDRSKNGKGMQNIPYIDLVVVAFFHLNLLETRACIFFCWFTFDYTR